MHYPLNSLCHRWHHRRRWREYAAVFGPESRLLHPFWHAVSWVCDLAMVMGLGPE